VPAARLLIGLGVIAAAVVLFVVLRPAGDEDEPAADATPPATAPTATVTAPEEPETEPGETAPEVETETGPAAPEPATLSIVLRNGLPEGGIQRLTVRRDEDVRVVVRSDTPDEIHLHGYDLERPVGPGAPAQLRFTATIAGVFELETHTRHVVVGEVEVRP
jgi:hypothetical protein